MNFHRLVAAAIISTPLLFASTFAQTPAAKPDAQAKKPASAAAAGGVRTVEIVGTDQMKYDVTSIPAKRGEQLRIRLTSKGTMPKIAMAHNVVVLALKANAVKFVTAGAQSRETDFIPADMKDQVIAQTPLAGAGETVETTFKVPNVAGQYPFVCTFPGHFQAGMQGNLVVK
jgi:azurin